MRVSFAGASVLGMPLEKRVIEQRFSVAYEYPVVFGRGLLQAEQSALSPILARFSKGLSEPCRVFAVLDAGVTKCWPDLASDVRRSVERDGRAVLVDEPLVIPGGELAKNDERILKRLYDEINRFGLDRHAFILAIGGGAVLDVVGFAAATAHRGLRLVRVPTTVLAQADSGVGVKNSVNAFEAKNFLGTFAPPVAVLNDFDLLATLDRRDQVAGMAEAVKVSLVKDGAFFDWLDEHAEGLAEFEPSLVERLIERTAELHLEHIAVAGDAFERQSSRPLDYGHWVAHKLESLSDHALRHGEAVAIGMAIDTAYAASCGLLASPTALRIKRLILRLGLPIWHAALDHKDERGRPSFLLGLEEFRQHMGGELSVTLLTDIGCPKQVHALDEAVILEQVRRLELGSKP